MEAVVSSCHHTMPKTNGTLRVLGTDHCLTWEERRGERGGRGEGREEERERERDINVSEVLGSQTGH